MNFFQTFIIQNKQALNLTVPWYVRHSAHFGLNIYHAMNDSFIIIISFSLMQDTASMTASFEL